ncbi:hypothetical protein F5Y09DRAFT_25850 [Xylaria sp. FL1042]|nr:hypothetical protein F5Y09DRAFT_25850 [Xylaria sp. FL1042]
MFISTSAALAAAAILAGHAVAKTDIAGCVSSQTVAYGGASLIWYVPDTGEICAFLDCGGGLAPPKTTVPGCPDYKGTATYSPSYLPGFGSAATSTVSSFPSAEATAGSSTSDDSSSSGKATITLPPTTTITGTATSLGYVQTQTGSDSAATLSSSSSAASSASAGASTSNVSTGGAVFPTGSLKGAFGVMAGMAAGVALL